MLHANHLPDAALLGIVRLMVDDTTAHIIASAQKAEALLAWFHDQGIPCDHRRGGGVGGLDVIDFGDPHPTLERRIRVAFAAWQSRTGRGPSQRGNGQRGYEGASTVLSRGHLSLVAVSPVGSSGPDSSPGPETGDGREILDGRLPRFGHEGTAAYTSR